MSLEQDCNYQAVESIPEYHHIESLQPHANYDECVAFLRRQAQELRLPLQVVSSTLGKPTVVISWAGSQPELPGIMLNSHMDVVPVFPEERSYDPIEAHRDADEIIFARRSQDMNSVGVQYLEAVRRLKASGARLLRTVHLAFLPDEEVGGAAGTAQFLQTPDFARLNVGFQLDEGMPHPEDNYAVFYGRSSAWRIEVYCPGSTSHDSLLMHNTAAEKVRMVMDRAMEFSQREKLRLEHNPSLTMNEVTSLNVITHKGGFEANVVPPEMGVVMDIRIAPSVDHGQFEAMLQQWCVDAGPGTYIEFLKKEPQETLTPADENNPWWLAFKSAADAMNMSIKTSICPGGTDAKSIRRYLLSDHGFYQSYFELPLCRQLGMFALGFSPVNLAPNLLHAHNESLHGAVFLRGIEVYCKIIEALGNVPK